MQKFIKFFGAAVFMAALFVNLSLNANKKATNTDLIGFTSVANAACEYDGANNHYCRPIWMLCDYGWWPDSDAMWPCNPAY